MISMYVICMVQTVLAMKHKNLPGLSTPKFDKYEQNNL